MRPIVDVVLPGRDGFALCRDARRRRHRDAGCCC